MFFNKYICFVYFRGITSKIILTGLIFKFYYVKVADKYLTLLYLNINVLLKLQTQIKEYQENNYLVFITVNYS